MMTIHPILGHDLTEIMAIEVKTQQFPWRLSQLQSSLDENHQAWMLCEKGKILAYIIWREILDEAELLTISVSPDCQRKSYGQQLLQFMCQQCRQRQMKKCFLEVAENNHKAISFYMKHGYVEIDRRKNYYQAGGVTAIVMCLVL